MIDGINYNVLSCLGLVYLAAADTPSQALPVLPGRTQ